MSININKKLSNYQNISNLKIGRRIGIDFGTVKIGISICDPKGILATPLETIQVKNLDKSDEYILKLLKIIAENEAVEIIVGLPYRLNNVECNKSAKSAIKLATCIAKQINPITVWMSDERFTTVLAQNYLHELNSNIKKKQKSIIDQLASVSILQNWLDTHKVFSFLYKIN